MKRPTTLSLLLLLAACGGSSIEQGKVDLAPLPNASAGCEEPSAAALVPGPEMLPGRVCQECHTKDGEALSTFTASGTVYGTREGQCGDQGLEGVTVDILDEEGNVQVTLTTNKAGNFYTSQAIALPMRAKLTLGDKTAVMGSTMAVAACAACHQAEPESGAPGRLYLE
jgi:cytochrome c553